MRWRICRAVAALIAVPCGATLAVMSLQIRWHLSGGTSRSNRYSHTWGLELLDAALAMSLAALVVPRLVWLLVDLVARWRGNELPGTFVDGEEFWAVFVPGTLLAYLVYVSNVRDTSFWPTAFLIVAVGIFRHGFRKSSAIRRGHPQSGRLTMR